MAIKNAIRFTVTSIKAVKPSNTRAIPIGNFQLPTLCTRIPCVAIIRTVIRERTNKISVVKLPIKSGSHFNFLPTIEVKNAPARDMPTKSGSILDVAVILVAPLFW